MPLCYSAVDRISFQFRNRNVQIFPNFHWTVVKRPPERQQDVSTEIAKFIIWRCRSRAPEKWTKIYKNCVKPLHCKNDPTIACTSVEVYLKKSITIINVKQEVSVQVLCQPFFSRVKRRKWIFRSPCWQRYFLLHRLLLQWSYFGLSVTKYRMVFATSIVLEEVATWNA